jgi:ABC-type glutathione transport system ATPase component
MSTVSGTEPLLAVRNLCKTFRLSGGHDLVAVDDVSFTLAPGDSLGIVGESGSGKTTTARIIAGLEGASAGEIWFDGRVVTGKRKQRAAAREIQMVFQDPFGSLDPRQRIGAGIEELLGLHFELDRTARKARAAQMLEEVGLAARHAAELPRNLSGGQRQRVAIARALALEPRLLILDEAVSALDVSVQAQIINLLLDIRERNDVAFLFVSHDLAVVRQLCERSIVMQHGRVVEVGSTAEILDQPSEQYTRQLIDAIPRPGWRPRRRLYAAS